VRFFAPVKPLVVADGADPWAARGTPPTGDELNGASVVAVVSVGSVDVLLPGDAEADTLSWYDLPPVDLVVVPHHGSRGAVSEALLKRLGARVAVVSVGADNSFGHPFPGTLALLERLGIAVLRTDTMGWVSCKVNGDTLAITTERTPTR
jgi:competence protein ComEC